MQTHKEYIQELIKVDKIQEALQSLLEGAEASKENDLHGNVILLMSRYNSNEKRNDLGTISNENYLLEAARIRNSLVSFLKEYHPVLLSPKNEIPTIPNNNPSLISSSKMQTKSEIFFSYAWDDAHSIDESREEIVNELYQSLKKEGYNVVRDKNDLDYKGSISDFMKRIGKGDFIIVVLSDKYLKSPNCMFELLEMYRKSNSEITELREKIFPIVLSGAKIYNLMDSLDYIEHWKNEKDTLKARIDKVGLDHASEIVPIFRMYKEIADNIGVLTNLLRDMNTLNPAILSEDNFAKIKKAIIKRVETFLNIISIEKNEKFDVNNAVLLHAIPNKMQINNLHRCIIRIALDKDIIIKNLPVFVKEKKVIEGIRISEQMEVTFLENDYFKIVPINKLRQPIEKDSFTEWNFNVQPLYLGTFPLTFTVSIITNIGVKQAVLDEAILVVIEQVPTSLIWNLSELTTLNTQNSKTITGNGNIVIDNVSNSPINIGINTNKSQNIDIEKIISLITDGDFSEAFEVLDKVDMGSNRMQYNLLKQEYMAGLIGIGLINFGKRLKTFVRLI